MDARASTAATGLTRAVAGTNGKAARVRVRCFHDSGIPVAVHVSQFETAGGARELHLIAQPTTYARIELQLEWLTQAYRGALAAAGTDESSAVLRRLFCSDPANEAAALARCPLAQSGRGETSCAVSVVGQPPVGPDKVVLWAYHVCDPAGPIDKRTDGTTLALRRGDLTHHWSTGLIAPTATGSHDQTREIFDAYLRYLAEGNMTLAENVLRTWLFVRDIDTNYAGLVDARRDLFAAHGLGAETHYIASTGIGGQFTDIRALVAMDAYAIAGVRAEQVRYLKARQNLSPTHIYGVTFERATAIDYRDRRHVLISGTASIDRHGRIAYPGDVQSQVDRTLDNIDALLEEAHATTADMQSWIVYLRDTCDYRTVGRQMRKRIGEAPMVLVTAPVCRPGWLVEIEGWATKAIDNPALPPF